MSCIVRCSSSVSVLAPQARRCGTHRLPRAPAVLGCGVERVPLDDRLEVLLHQLEPEPVDDPAQLGRRVAEDVLVAHQQALLLGQGLERALAGHRAANPELGVLGHERQPFLGRAAELARPLGPPALAAEHRVDQRVDDVAAVPKQEEHPGAREERDDGVGRVGAVGLLDHDPFREPGRTPYAGAGCRTPQDELLEQRAEDGHVVAGEEVARRPRRARRARSTRQPPPRRRQARDGRLRTTRSRARYRDAR